jgi:ABC-type Mn2+/Zn2+ transport system permease subunit
LSDLLDPLLEPWRSGITVRALVEVMLLGAICGPLGFWVLGYRLTYSVESLSHALLPGLVLAVSASVAPLLGAAVAAMVAAALIALAARAERVGADTATAVVVTGLVGLGALLAFAPDTPRNLGALLFGDPLAVTTGDLVAAVGLVAVGGVALAAIHRPLSAALFDPIAAPALGVRPPRVQLALLLLVAAAVCVAVQGLGSLLALALFVAPPLAVGRRARSAARAAMASSTIAVLGGMAGIYASYHLGLAAGAAVALALCAAAAAGALLGARPRSRAGVQTATQ